METFQFTAVKSKSRYLVWQFSTVTCARRQLTQQVRIHDHSAKRPACVPQQRDQPACFGLSARYRVGRTGAGDSQFLDHVCLYAAVPPNIYSLASSSTSQCSCSAVAVVGAYSLSRLWLFDRLISSQATVSRPPSALHLRSLRISRSCAGEVHRGKCRLHPTGSCIVGDMSGHVCQCHLSPYSICVFIETD